MYSFLIFIYLLTFGCARSSLLTWLSLVVASRGYSSCGAGASLCSGSSCCGSQAVACRVVVAWCTGLVALQHVECFQARSGTRVPCTGRWIPNHWATRQVPLLFLVCLLSWTISSLKGPWMFYSPLDPQCLALSRHSIKPYEVSEQMDS